MVANRGAQALQLVRSELPDIIVLDVSLPDIDGFTLCEQLHAMVGVPIVLLSARASIDDMLEGFRRGADDYMSKPFEMRLLFSRLRAVLRRVSAGEVSVDISPRSYPLGSGLFTTEFNEIRQGLVAVTLTPIEGKILRLLITNEGHVLALETILERIWGYDHDSNISIIKTHIRRLRLKIETVVGSAPVIHTVPGLGYTFRQNSPTPLQFAPILDVAESS